MYATFQSHTLYQNVCFLHYCLKDLSQLSHIPSKSSSIDRFLGSIVFGHLFFPPTYERLYPTYERLFCPCPCTPAYFHSACYASAHLGSNKWIDFICLLLMAYINMCICITPVAKTQVNPNGHQQDA